MGNHVMLFGSIRTTGNITIGRSCMVHGNLFSTRGIVKIDRNCRILGKIMANSIQIHETSKADGEITSPGNVLIERDDLDGFDDFEKDLFYGFLLLEDV